MSAYWRGRRVMVTGGSGFLGRRVVERLNSLDVGDLFVPRSADYDLRTSSGIAAAVRTGAPDVLIHLAGLSGGIGANREIPGRMFYDNAIMGIQLLEAARVANVAKFVTMGTVCSYPKYAPLPFREADLWNGYPEETNAAYGLAKKMLLVQGQAYRQQYDFDSIHLVAVNLYGPGDKLDPRQSHVIPALIRKCIEARTSGAATIDVWGTGAASREFLYVEDAAEGIILAAEHYDSPEPVNLGSGVEITIRELVSRIVLLTKYSGRIRWDVSKPDGQPRRGLDVSVARRDFGFEAATTLDRGLERTVEWIEEYLSIERPT